MAPLKSGPKPKGYKPFPAQLRPDQITAIRDDGKRRGYNQGNAVLRDVVDFWLANRPLFLAFLASRGETPQGEVQS